MKRALKISAFCLLLIGLTRAATFDRDTLQTGAGPLTITFIGHGTLYFEFDGKVIHVDPWSRLADYAALPKADIILITHHHRDHLDVQAIEAAKKEGTTIILTQTSAKQVHGEIMKNGEHKLVKGIEIQAVPAYNIQQMRSENKPYHPRGEGNGYVISFADKKVYVAGDTENIPEMAELKGTIDVAFLPMNLPYTMTPEMAADAAKKIQPGILYPYHFGDTDVQQLIDLLKNSKIDIRIRNMK